MFRNLYFLLILATTNLCFCYHHKAEGNCHNEIHSKIHRNTNHRRRIPRTSPRQSYDDLGDDAQVAQIDVASFIQNNNEYGPLDSYRPHKNIKKSSKSNKKDKYKLSNDKSDSYLNYQMPHEFKDNSPSVDEKSYLKYDSLPSSFNYNNYGESYHYKDRSVENSKYKESQPQPKKKSGFKLQFPFFSHKSDKDKKKSKSGSKSKSNKSPESLAEDLTREKKSTDFNERDHEEEAHEEEEVPLERVKKRSYIERVCPACRRKFIDQEQKQRKRKSPKMIHNSRQYFQEKANKEKTTSNPQERLFEQDDMDYDKYTDADIKDSGTSKARIQKRQEASGADTQSNNQEVLDNRDRQLKELQEVERRVENTQILRAHDKVLH